MRLLTINIFVTCHISFPRFFFSFLFIFKFESISSSIRNNLLIFCLIFSRRCAYHGKRSSIHAKMNIFSIGDSVDGINHELFHFLLGKILFATFSINSRESKTVKRKMQNSWQFIEIMIYFCSFSQMSRWSVKRKKKNKESKLTRQWISMWSKFNWKKKKKRTF